MVIKICSMADWVLVTSGGYRCEHGDLVRNWSPITSFVVFRHTAKRTDNVGIWYFREVLGQTLLSFPSLLPPQSLTLGFKRASVDMKAFTERLKKLYVYINLCFKFNGYDFDLLFSDKGFWMFGCCIISHFIQTVRGHGRTLFLTKLTIGIPCYTFLLWKINQ